MDALKSAGEVLRRDAGDAGLFRLDAREGQDDDRGKNKLDVVAAAIFFYCHGKDGDLLTSA